MSRVLDKVIDEVQREEWRSYDRVLGARCREQLHQLQDSAGLAIFMECVQIRVPVRQSLEVSEWHPLWGLGHDA